MTKQQLIQLALEEIGISSNEFDVTPAEFESALRRLDAMMSDWNVRGIRLGYPLASIANSVLSDETNIPDSANDAIISNLALKLAPSFGRQVSREIKVSAKNGYNTLLMRAGVTDPVEKQLPSTLPLGAGHKTYRNQRGNFMPSPTDPVDAGPDSVLDF